MSRSLYGIGVKIHAVVPGSLDVHLLDDLPHRRHIQYRAGFIVHIGQRHQPRFATELVEQLPQLIEVADASLPVDSQIRNLAIRLVGHVLHGVIDSVMLRRGADDKLPGGLLEHQVVALGPTAGENDLF